MLSSFICNLSENAVSLIYFSRVLISYVFLDVSWTRVLNVLDACWMYGFFSLSPRKLQMITVCLG